MQRPRNDCSVPLDVQEIPPQSLLGRPIDRQRGVRSPRSTGRPCAQASAPQAHRTSLTGIAPTPLWTRVLRCRDLLIACVPRRNVTAAANVAQAGGTVFVGLVWVRHIRRRRSRDRGHRDGVSARAVLRLLCRLGSAQRFEVLERIRGHMAFAPGAGTGCELYITYYIT